MALSDAQQMRVMTAFGPVSLGEKRTRPQQLQVQGSVGNKGETLTIGPDWLKKVAQSDEQMYHIAIKQAMLLGARRVDINDCMEKWDKTEDDMMLGVDESVKDEMRAKVEKLGEFQDQAKHLISGVNNRNQTIEIHVTGHTKSVLKKVVRQEERERSLLVKKGRKMIGCCQTRERRFIIENGQLVIYKNNSKTAKQCHPTYSMAEARIFVEEKVEGFDPDPKFHADFTHRINCKFDERTDAGKSPLYLYPKNDLELKYWLKAFKLARSLKSANDRTSLKACIGRTTSALLIKGWETFFWYHRELRETRDLVHQMAMRLMQAEISRGWHKLRLLWDKEVHKDNRRQEQQHWAARYLSEKLARIGNSSAKQPEEVREQVITRIQDRFRNFRDDAIFDRSYPIGNNTVLRSQQSRAGIAVEAGYDAQDCDSILRTFYSRTANDAYYKAAPMLLRTKVSSYSEASFTPSPRLLCVSDNLQSLTFQMSKFMDTGDSNLMTKTALANFVNLDRISQVVIHSSPHPEALEPRPRTQPGNEEERKLLRKKQPKDDAGIWCTIYGPRISWCKRVLELKDPKTDKTEKFVVGAQNGFAVPDVLGRKFSSKPIDSCSGIQYLTVKVNLAGQFDVTAGLRDLQQEHDPELFKMETVEVHVHLLGYGFKRYLDPTSGRLSTGPNGPRTKPDEFEARVPIAIDDAGSALLDTSAFTISIVQVLSLEPGKTDPDTGKNKVMKEVLFGRIMLAKAFGVNDNEVSNIAKYKTSAQVELRLQKPGVSLDVDPQKPQEGPPNYFRLQFSGRVDKDTEERDHQPVSPEFVGAGNFTSLYTSHRGAWYNRKYAHTYRDEHVANFVELVLGDFRFPLSAADAKGEDGNTVYRVRASVMGITAVSPPMHRSKKEWAEIFADKSGGGGSKKGGMMDMFRSSKSEGGGGGKSLGLKNCDPQTILFEGFRLCLPLPPGGWSLTTRDPEYITIMYGDKQEEYIRQDSGKTQNGKFIYRSSSGIKLSYQVPQGKDGNNEKATKVGRKAWILEPPEEKTEDKVDIPLKQVLFNDSEDPFNSAWKNIETNEVYSPAILATGFQNFQLDIEVVKTTQAAPAPLPFKTFMKDEKRSNAAANQEQVVYHSTLSFEYLNVDESRSVSAFFEPGPIVRGKEILVDVQSGNVMNRPQQKDLAQLSLEFCLRDRDYCRATLGKPGEQRTLCVGDKALMFTEEPMTYPKTLPDFKTRFCQGEFEETLLDCYTAEQNKQVNLDAKVEQILRDKLEEIKKNSPDDKSITNSKDWIHERKARIVCYADQWTNSDYHDGRLPKFLADCQKERVFDTKELTYEGKPGITVKIQGGGGNSWVQELRDPCLSSEYSASGLEYMVPKVHYRPSVIPNFCEDIVPHKFVLPQTEIEFKQRNLPGIWPNLLDDLQKLKKENPRKWHAQGQGNLKRIAVERLTRNWRNIPVTLLAMYPDGTCDVEIATTFLEKWRDHPLREYCIPGTRTLKADPGTSKDAQGMDTVVASNIDSKEKLYAQVDNMRRRFGPEGLQKRFVLYDKGQRRIFPQWFQGELMNDFDDKEAKKLFPLTVKMREPIGRVFAKGVPSVLLTAVHSAGFHLYDANCKTLDQVIDTETPEGTFNPRGNFSQTTVGKLDTDESTVIKAGPLPGDTSPASCSYEWSLSVRCKNETDMYRFVAMMRQNVRLSQFLQSQRAEEMMMKYAGQTGPVELDEEVLRQRVGGQLEVVLVECRRLEPAIFKGVHKLKEQVSDINEMFTTQKNRLGALGSDKASKSTPDGADINTFVKFRMSYATGPGGLDREVLAVKNAKHQSSSVCEATNSPCWADDFKEAGGYTFRSGLIDPEKLQDLVLEFEVMHAFGPTARLIGEIQVGVNRRPNLTDPKNPFRNLWLPLYTRSDFMKDTKHHLHPNGEMRIMTRWTPADKMHLPQPSIRSSFMKELWPRLNQIRIKEPIYEVEPHYLAYNPNIGMSENGGRPAETPPDFFRRQIESLYSELKYMECLDRKQTTLWEVYESRLRDMHGFGSIHLGDLRAYFFNSRDAASLDHLHKLLEDGIPVFQREKRWIELTGASYYMFQGVDPNSEAEVLAEAAERSYQVFLQKGLPQNSDANLQLQEDCFHLASWESASREMPELLDFHLTRIKKAQNVCTALIAFQECGTCYCESLLIIAFFLLLPQGIAESKQSAVEDDTTAVSMTEPSAFWILHQLITGAYSEYFGRQRSQPPVDHEGGSRMMVSGEPLCINSGAMDDVSLLEACIAYYEPDLWSFFNRIGFQMQTVFYGAFTRLYATFLPTATLFRFWDILLPYSTHENAKPHARAYLIDLAFGVFKTRKAEFMNCQSAYEMRCCLLQALGSMYDMSTVVELTLHYHRFLWEMGGGYSEGRIAQLCAQRKEIFRMVDSTTWEQNEVLKEMTHVCALGTVKRTAYQSDSGVAGVQTSEMVRQVMPVLKASIESMRPGTIDLFQYVKGSVPTCEELLDAKRKAMNLSPEDFEARVRVFDARGKKSIALRLEGDLLKGDYDKQGEHDYPLNVVMETESGTWAMHRPMPLVAKILNENTIEKTTERVKEMLNWGELDVLPRAIGPKIYDKSIISADSKHPARDRHVKAMDSPMLGHNTFSNSLRMELANWDRYASPIWDSFTNRRDAVRMERMKESADEEIPIPGMDKLMAFLTPVFGNYEIINLRKMMKMNNNVQAVMSMNELFISLICCSRGTLGLKASAMFEVYGYSLPSSSMLDDAKHVMQPSNFAKSITQVDAAKKKVVMAPDPDKEGENALHFTVWSNYPTPKTLVGSVFIPMLSEFESSMGKEMTYQTYNIWGPPPADVQQAQGGFVDDSGGNFIPEPGRKSYSDQPGKDDSKGTVRSTSSDNHTKKRSRLMNFFFGNSVGEASMMDEFKAGSKKQVCLGDMTIGITWLPSGTSGSDRGQLVVHLRSIQFYRMYVTEPYRKNPFVTLSTSKKVWENNEATWKDKQIERWDPRGIFSTDQHNSWLLTHGAFGGIMLWYPSMKEGILQRDNFRTYRRDGNQGWDAEKEEWTWNDVWGLQYSVPDFQFDKEFVKKSLKKNVIDLQGIRHIVSNILTRSCLNLSNRQMVLIADTLFSRSGTVPGILEAVLVPTKLMEDTPEFKIANKDVNWKGFVDPKTGNDLIQMRKHAKWPSSSEQDVSNIMAMEHEKQIRFNGSLNLFTPEYLEWHKDDKGPIGAKFSLSIYGLQGASISSKTMWIRYVRAGDGERCTQGVVFEDGVTGAIKEAKPKPEIFIDLPEPCMQMFVTREEFITCMMSSPLLGETIRRMSATDHVMQEKKPIALDVTIMDPQEGAEDEAFQDAINFQQSILLEVWDNDVVNQDFLGEAWLPPLETLSKERKGLVLKLQPADFSEESERGPSRQHWKKITGDKNKKEQDKNKKVSGDLYIDVQWVYPKWKPQIDDSDPDRRQVLIPVAYPTEDEEKNMNMNMEAENIPTENGEAKLYPQELDRGARAQVQVALHTGYLSIWIKRARGLRRADAARYGMADPFVQVWRRNDATKEFKQNYLFKTQVCKGTTMPDWEKKGEPVRRFDILVGAFEEKIDDEDEGILEQIKDAFKSSKAKRREEDEKEVAALDKFGNEGLKVKFGASTTEGDSNDGKEKAKGGEEEVMLGANHLTEVYLGDSIREFKSKVVDACTQESSFWRKKGVSFNDKAQKYASVALSYKHLVMIFVPTPRVQQLAMQGKYKGAEYTHQYNLALADPSSWQPLDPTRTFYQYPQFQFSNVAPQQIRIVEATESYKLLNARYKEFEASQERNRYDEINTLTQSYGYAKYIHPLDSTEEWRPAIITADPKQAPCYSVDWCFKPFKPRKEKVQQKTTGSWKGNVRLEIVSAAGLRNADYGFRQGKSDPYVIFSVKNKPEIEELQTETINDTLNPTWDFKQEIGPLDENDTLVFKVMDKDPTVKPGGDDCIGGCELDMKSAKPHGRVGGIFAESLQLFDVKNSRWFGKQQGTSSNKLDQTAGSIYVKLVAMETETQPLGEDACMFLPMAASGARLVKERGNIWKVIGQKVSGPTEEPARYAGLQYYRSKDLSDPIKGRMAQHEDTVEGYKEEKSDWLRVKEDVLLAPRVPLMSGTYNDIHEEVLPEAINLRRMGFSDWEIEAHLNKDLDEVWEKKKGTGAGGAKPPKITVDIIRAYMQRVDYMAIRGIDTTKKAEDPKMMTR